MHTLLLNHIIRNVRFSKFTVNSNISSEKINNSYYEYYYFTLEYLFYILEVNRYGFNPKPLVYPMENHTFHRIIIEIKFLSRIKGSNYF